MPIAAAIVGSAVIGAGVNISASNKAAKVARETADKNNALQTDIYNQNKAALSPFVAQGSLVTPTINGLLGLGDTAAADRALQTYQNSTGYQARLAQGQGAVTSSLGSRGLLDSGAAQKALLKYGQTFASNEFANYMGALQGQQQIGFGAASAQAGVGQNYANAVSSNNNTAANIQANAALANAGSINAALGSVVGAYGASQAGGSSYGNPITAASALRYNDAALGAIGRNPGIF